VLENLCVTFCVPWDERRTVMLTSETVESVCT